MSHSQAPPRAAQAPRATTGEFTSGWERSEAILYLKQSTHDCVHPAGRAFDGPGPPLAAAPEKTDQTVNGVPVSTLPHFTTLYHT